MPLINEALTVSPSQLNGLQALHLPLNEILPQTNLITSDIVVIDD